MKTKTNNIFIIIGLLFFLVAYILINKRNKEVEESGIKTVGYIYYTGTNVQYGSKYCKYIYYSNRARYEGVKSYYKSEYNVKKKSFYEVIYDPKNPDNSDILLNNKISFDSVCTYFEEECPFDVQEDYK
jgi:hypothetical protein